MPEYLAPGVYAEETSFRAKSLEGVGTSTTGFAGPARKGPLGAPVVGGNVVVATPEIITSFGDFERIYGGLDDLALLSPTNYLAHSVHAFFNNGGARLYISRVFLPGADTGVAQSADVTNGGLDLTKQTRFKARYPGAAGNGTVEVFEKDTPATVRSMNSAREGTLLRLGGDAIATGANITGGAGPSFSLPPGSVLKLNVNGVDAPPITFHGESAEVVGVALPDPIPLTDATRSLQITIDGVPQTIVVPGPSVARADAVDLINQKLTGGYARRTPAEELAIGSDRKGTLSSVTVTGSAAFGLAGGTALGSSIAANDVGDLNKVTADEISVLLTAAGIAVHAGLSASLNKLVLNTALTGSGANLTVVDATAAGTVSAHNALGLTPAVQARGTAGATNTYFVKRGSAWQDAAGAALNLGGLNPSDQPGGGPANFITVNVIATDADSHTLNYEDMALDGGHPQYIGNVFGMKQSRRTDDLEHMFGVSTGSAVTAFDLRTAFFGASKDRVISLTGGNDGGEPIQLSYDHALQSFEKLDDISIVAAPGHSAFVDFQGIQSSLISHAEKRRSYRIAVLDTPVGQAISDARNVRGKIDSTYAAIYYPWVYVSNPLFRPGLDNISRELLLPPSGFMCGIYARNDVERGVYKAPANEVVRGALRFENDINFAQQEVLNPLGVNCLRYFPGRGYRIWGARTASSDPEWKYVNVRRYFIYLEATIDRGTQWAVFEPNGEALWRNVRETVTAFLYNEFVSGALLGATPEEAFFVRCDRSTMTQADLDNGRLICLVGVAALKPAEFIIFRIGQKTADAKS